VDNQICVEHCVPHGTSNHDYKGIAGDQGRIIFNGRIHILPGASQTSANLSNKNLLLSQGAEIDSKPELEIYNDDVKCSHGTTIGKLDPDMRFYMQSRGIDATAAQRMLSMGFIQQQIDALSDEPLANWIRQWLEQAVTEVSA
jgi:Fe-S cluster assembly protein SufD